MKNIMREFGDTLKQLPLVALDNQAKLLFISHFTRYLDDPVSVIVSGESGTGKTNLMTQIQKFFAQDSYIEVTAMTAKAMANLPKEIVINRKTLMCGELAGIKSEDGNYLLRQALSEGKVTRWVPVEGKVGETNKTVTQTVEGKFNMFLTTTDTEMHPEDENRFFRINIPNDEEYINFVLHKQVELKNNPKKFEVNFSIWHTLSEKFLEDIIPVKINYMHNIVDNCKNKNKARLVRDINKVISLIKVHTIFNIDHREKDDEGNLLSTLDDYEVIYNILSECFRSSERFISRDLENIVNFTKDANKEGINSNQFIMGEVFNYKRSKISRLCKAAEELGLISNLSPNGVNSSYVFIKDYKNVDFFLPDPIEIAV